MQKLQKTTTFTLTYVKDQFGLQQETYLTRGEAVQRAVTLQFMGIKSKLYEKQVTLLATFGGYRTGMPLTKV